MATQIERRKATRSRILEVAQRLFTANGYEVTTTGSVLAGAKLSRGALYHHFPSKGAPDRLEVVFHYMKGKEQSRWSLELERER